MRAVSMSVDDVGRITADATAPCLHITLSWMQLSMGVDDICASISCLNGSSLDSHARCTTVGCVYTDLFAGLLMGDEAPAAHASNGLPEPTPAQPPAVDSTQADDQVTLSIAPVGPACACMHASASQRLRDRAVMMIPQTGCYLGCRW